MFGRAGAEVLGSARQYSAREVARPVPNPLLSPSSNTGSFGVTQPYGFGGQAQALPELPARRKAAVKKAFKRVDVHGQGSLPLDRALQTLAGAPTLGPQQLQELKAGFERVAKTGADGRPMLTFPAFCQYYQAVSAGLVNDGDFEQLLEAQWGCQDVSGILSAMQRQFARVGLMHAFQEMTRNGQLSEVGPEDFKACLKNVGLHARPDEMQRLFTAFQGPNGGMRMPEFKEQIVSPRPETPMLTRDLPMGLGPPGPAPFSGMAGTGPAGPSAAPVPASSGPSSGHVMPSAAGPPPSDADLDAMLNKMEGELHGLRKKQPGAGSPGQPGQPPQSAHSAHRQPHEADGPANVGDLDAALSRMEDHLHHIKAHHQVQAAPAPAPPPVEMPHWEHHKYGHHEIKAPEWKPQDKITDAYGQQHASGEYNYSNFGAGAHSHHLAHYHVNDYGSLQHHAFQQQEFHRQQFGDAAHHGHWVPHLHGLGTASHQGEHAYKQDDYQKESYGKDNEHSHWVPHLHGLGELQK